MLISLIKNTSNLSELPIQSNPFKFPWVIRRTVTVFPNTMTLRQDQCSISPNSRYSSARLLFYMTRYGTGSYTRGVGDEKSVLAIHWTNYVNDSVQPFRYYRGNNPWRRNTRATRGLACRSLLKALTNPVGPRLVDTYIPCHIPEQQT